MSEEIEVPKELIDKIEAAGPSVSALANTYITVLTQADLPTGTPTAIMAFLLLSAAMGKSLGLAPAAYLTMAAAYFSSSGTIFTTRSVEEVANEAKEKEA